MNKSTEYSTPFKSVLSFLTSKCPEKYRVFSDEQGITKLLHKATEDIARTKLNYTFPFSGLLRFVGNSWHN